MHSFIFIQSHKHLNVYLYTITYLWVITLFTCTVHVSLQKLVSTQLTFELRWQLAGHNFRPCVHVTCLTTGFTYSTCRCCMYMPWTVNLHGSSSYEAYCTLFKTSIYYCTLPKIKHPNRTISSNRGKHVPSSTSTAECNIIHLMYKSCKQHSQYLNHKLHVINTSPLSQDCTTDLITGKLWINNNFIHHVTPCWAELSILVHTHLFIMSNELCLDMSWYHVHPSKDLTSLLFITKHTL